MNTYTREDCYKTYSASGRKVRYWNPKLVNVLISIIMILFGIFTFILAQGESNSFGAIVIFLGILVAIAPVGTKVKKTKKNH